MNTPGSLHRTASRETSLSSTLFVCQRCHKGIVIDKSLEEIDESVFGNTNLYAGEMNSESAVLTTLLELASDSSQMDHPLCNECSQLVTFELHKQLAEIEHENDRYTQFYTQLTENEGETDQLDTINMKIRQLEESQQTSANLLEEVKKERKKTEVEIERYTLELKKSELIEERFWETLNEFEEQIREYNEENNSVLEKKRQTHSHLESLRTTDVFNDTFHISRDGHFGTINSLRIGSLPSQPVDWNEINAAWGEASLLLDSLAKRIQYKFKAYRIIPSGSYSKVERLSDGSIYELYGSREITLGKLLWYRRFDTAMVAFLGCLKEITDYVCKLDSSVRMPFTIVREKIGGMSIKKQFSSDEEWTRALKLMLINLKYVLAAVTKQAHVQRASLSSLSPIRIDN